MCVLATQSCLAVCVAIELWHTTLSMEFSRQEYWSGLPCPPRGDLPNPGMKLGSPSLQADSLLIEPLGKLFRYD